MSDLCLHCRLVEVIDAYYQEHGERHGDHVLLDVPEILEALGQVAAEHIAAHPDTKERKRLVKELARGIGDAVPVIRARGPSHYPAALVPS